MYFSCLHRSQSDSLKFLNCFKVQDYIAAVQVRLTQNQQNTRATKLCWHIAFCRTLDYLRIVRIGNNDLNKHRLIEYAIAYCNIPPLVEMMT